MIPEFPSTTAPRSGTLSIEGPRGFTDADKARNHVLSAGGEGWICTTDNAARVPSPTIGAGPLLSAEISLGDERSMHVRYDGTTWRIWELVERLGTGEHLAIDETFLSTEGAARLVYRTWWRLEPEVENMSVWRPFASRFVGWSK